MTCDHPEESFEIKEERDYRVFYEFCEHPFTLAIVCGICGQIIDLDVPFEKDDYAI